MRKAGELSTIYTLQSELKGFSLISLKNSNICSQSTLPLVPTETVQEKVLSLKSNSQVTSSNIYLRIRSSDKNRCILFEVIVTVHHL